MDAAVFVDVHAVEAEADDECPDCAEQIQIKASVGGRSVIT